VKIEGETAGDEPEEGSIDENEEDRAGEGPEKAEDGPLVADFDVALDQDAHKFAVGQDIAEKWKG
jgi:hypothetical protein